ncbi:hypothetical protein CYPRO_0534 [Cyclonatronum proteinivorum]|uniref:Type I restriction enzyme R protein N-terminal domain-containing protein n=1 Tax=Cyclonatronum proteinivorum TaxID=1457365 RepID=A0A345UH67_9BACT|nr:type I restriction enzyme HsdR N-terminal domain-containing protein [Cyclonatronum proteinivorum]AXI99818.1 hypothetical protein CYPRO_0534 [Cyclonatronum proteinivorum]
MSLKSHLEKIQRKLREGAFTSEASVSQGILLPTLNELGWPVFDTSIVSPEFTVENRRVDYALCHPKNKPAIFIEVKNVGLSDGADRQLFEYAFHTGVPMAILTDGQEWSFYLPGEQGRYDERRVYKIDCLERSITEIEERLVRYLNYQRVASGDALRAARDDYRNVSRHRIIAANIPKAWVMILKEQDAALLDLLAEKVEDLCGFKPDLDVCGEFLSDQVSFRAESPVVQGTGGRNKGKTSEDVKPGQKHPENSKPRPRKMQPISWELDGEKLTSRSARQVMTTLFERLAEKDDTFLERFASRKHGRKRRYLARNKYELYPGRSDLAEKNAVEIAQGWWLGTNYSKRNVQEIIDLALEVTDPALRRKIKVSVI